MGIAGFLWTKCSFAKGVYHVTQLCISVDGPKAAEMAARCRRSWLWKRGCSTDRELIRVDKEDRVEVRAVGSRRGQQSWWNLASKQETDGDAVVGGKGREGDGRLAEVGEM